MIENSQKAQLRTFHDLQSHLACRHTKMCTLVRKTICESLDIYTSDMKIPKKRNKIKGPFLTCSYIWHFGISECDTYLFNTYSVKFW